MRGEILRAFFCFRFIDIAPVLQYIKALKKSRGMLVIVKCKFIYLNSILHADKL